MIDCAMLPLLGTTYPPASMDDIHRAEAGVGHAFPPLYRVLLQCSNGYDPVTERYSISLFSTDDLAEMNDAYNVGLYVPTLLMIGSDGGGRGIFLDRESDAGAVYLCGMGDLDRAEAVFLASELADWIANHFDLNDPPDEIHPENIDVYLLQPPHDGIRGLFRLREALQLSITPREFRAVLEHLPYCLLQGVPYDSYAWMCRRHHQSDPCLYICEADQFDVPLPFQIDE